MATKTSAAKKAAPAKAAGATEKSRTRAKAETHLRKQARSAGDIVDEQLARYRSMRDFDVTAEPSGGHANRTGSAPDALPFVIQKHAATRLHYDFRLGWNGVLKSWAVAKGPSYNVKNKRLAVEVEDHPMEYGGFEGIIPKGQYGGGTVMVWDHGTWEPHVNVEEGLRKGSLKFAMNGTKMHGNWALVRMGGRAAHEGGKPNWLLIKEHDQYERGPGDPCITDEAPNSAVTGRSLDEIASAETHVWNSKESNIPGQAWYRTTKSGEAPSDGLPARKTASRSHAEAPAPRLSSSPAKDTASVAQHLTKLPKEALPEFLRPQLAEEAKAPPSTDEWLHEIKLDGYRMQARKQGSSVQLLTRSGLDWTHRMKPVADAVRSLPAESALMDGEVVVLDDSGLSSFALLQASFEQGERHPMTYFVFDLLHLNGHNTRGLPLLERKALLGKLVGDNPDKIRMSEHLSGNGEDVFHHACELHTEGIVSKKASAAYTSGRGSAWLKSKCLHEQELVIGGWTDLSNGQRGVGSLLLGYYDDAGQLIYAGRTGTGFTQKIHAMLRTRLEGIPEKTCPFVKIDTAGRRGAHWVKPDMVAQVRFATWTAGGQVRQAAYLGLREDKPANEVRKEEAAPTPKRDRSEGPVPQAEQATAPAASRSKRGGQSHASTPAARSLHAASNHVAAKIIAKPTPMKPAQDDSPLPVPPIRITHPAKVLDPASGMTKMQLASYLWAVADNMRPHVAGRPLSLVRCPEGSGKPCFYQKHVNHMLPAGVGSVTVTDKKGKPEPYITLESAEALAGLAQMSVLEVHPWGSRNETLEYPDRIIIDLDPDESLPWNVVSHAAEEVRKRLKKLGLESFLKTTGGKGLHVVFPLEPEQTFAVIKEWSHGFVMEMERDNPQLFLTKMTKAARVGKIYLDYLRNERGATAVAPYSTRARAGAPVSVPLAWTELTKMTERPHFTVLNFSEWRSRLKRDPWAKMAGVHQHLSPEVLARYVRPLRRTA